MGKELHKVFTAGLTILLRDNKVLLLKRSKNVSYEPGKYTLPSGSKEDNETALQAALRETLEEVGLRIDPLIAEFAQVMIRRKAGEEWIDFFFLARQWKGDPKVMEVDKCDEVGWFNIDDLPKNTIPFIKKALNNFKVGIKYSEFGFKN